MMSSLLDSVHTENASLGPYYQGVLAGTIAKLWRRKLLIMAVVVAALTLGTIGLLVTPKGYTAEAYIRGGFTASDVAGANVEKGAAGIIGIDAAELVETKSRVFQSHQLARQVLERLGVERLRPLVAGSPLSAWLQETFYGDATRDPEYQQDRAATRLLRSLSVKTEPRIYQITVQCTAGDPELAALVANTFVAEYLRSSALQKLSGQRASAQAALSEQLATYGDKHPKVAGARLRLEAVDALLKEQLSKPPEEIIRVGDENVTFAQAVAVPSSPDPSFFIGIALLIGLAIAVGLALFAETDN